MVLLDDFLANKGLWDLSDQELIEAFKDSPRDVLRKVNWSGGLNNPAAQRLARLIDRNVSLRLQLDRTLNRNPSLRPTPSAPPTPEPEAAGKTVPKYIPPQTGGPKAAPKNDINAQNAKAIQDWMNDLKKRFYLYLGGLDQSTKAKAFESSTYFTQNLWQFLTLYRGEIVGHYLSEAAYEMIFSALGPIGHMMHLSYFKNIEWRMAWQKNLLNPNVIYYYLNVLPTQYAFQIVTNPIRSGFAILARSGAPLISKITTGGKVYDPISKTLVNQVNDHYVFSPLLRGTQLSHLAADSLDKLVATKIEKEFTNKDGYDIAGFNKKIGKFIDSKSNKNLSTFLKYYDGFDDVGRPFGFMKAFLKKPINNTARRLRRTHNDPLSFLAVLIAGTVFDFTVGFALNVLRVMAVRTLSLIPGFNALRASALKFLSSQTWLTTFRAGGATLRSFLGAAFSPTAASSGFLGYQLGNFLFPNLTGSLFGLQVNVGGAIMGSATYGLGTMYKTAINLINSRGFDVLSWAKNYEQLTGMLNQMHGATFADELTMQLVRQDVYQGLEAYGSWMSRPGPVPKLVYWLSKNWAVRLPFNGVALANMLAPVMEANFGWSAIQTYLTFGGVDYFWQIKGRLFSWLRQQWIKSPWHLKYTSLQNPDSSISKFWRQIGYDTHFHPIYGEHWAEKPWLKFLKGFNNTFIKTFINPGLFLGFSFLGPIFTSMGLHPILGYIAGAAVGSFGWSATAWAIQQVSRTALSLTQLASRAWGGFLIGQAVLWIFPQLATAFWWLPYATGFGTLAVSAWGFRIAPLLSRWILAPLWGLITQLPLIGVFATNLATALAGITGGIALLPVITVIGTIATVVFIGFTLFSAVWVPYQEIVSAGPQSACFNLNPNATDSGSLCSNFRISSDLMTEKNFLTHGTEIYSAGMYENIDVGHPENLYVSVSRTLPGQETSNLSFVSNTDPNNFSSQNYSGQLTIVNYWESNYRGSSGTLPNAILTYLSTATDEPQTFAQLQQAFPNNAGLNQMSAAYLDLVKNSLEDKANNQGDTLALYRAQEDFLDRQKSNFETVVTGWSAVAGREELELIRTYLNEMITESLTTRINNNPYSSEIDRLEAACEFQPETCADIVSTYKSWPDIFQTQQSIAQRLLSRTTTITASDTTALQQLLADIDNDYKDAQETLEGIKQQLQSVKNIITQLEEVKNNLPADQAQSWLDLLTNINYKNLSSLDDANQLGLLTILQTLFGDIFGSGKKYYYVPKGTNYQICLNLKPRPGYEEFTSQHRTIIYGTQGLLNTAYCPAVSQNAITP